MAIDFTHPQTLDNYSTVFVPSIIANQIGQAQWLDSLQTTYTAGLAQYMKRYNRTTGLFEEYTGTAWGPLTLGYAALSGAAFTGGVSTSGNFSLAGASNGVVFTNAAGTTNQGGLTVTPAMTTLNAYAGGITMTNTAGDTLKLGAAGGFSISGALTVGGVLSAPGGITGAASLANSLNPTNNYQVGNLNGAGAYGLSTVSGSASLWYRTMFYNDGSSFYLMASAVQNSQASAQAAAYGAFRPFSYNLANGNVTIDGTGKGTSFGGNISINGNLNLPNGYIASNDGAWGMRYKPGVTGTNSDHLWTDINDSYLASLNSSGVFSAGTVTAGLVTETSDERTKENWAEPESSRLVDELSKIRKWGNFDWKSGGQSLGIGAQSLAVIYGFKNAINGDEDALTVNYSGAAMVSAVAISKEIQKIKARLDEIEAKA